MKNLEKPPEPVSLFLSYAREDELLLRKLEAHLSLLKRQEFISTWYDRLIVPGADWIKTIDEHLEQASIILLLVSPDFLVSDYCYQIEMRRALERHQDGQACVIPIAMRPADWNGAPFAHLQALPTDAKPVTAWDNLDEAFVDIATGIRRVIAALPLPLISTSRVTFPNVWNIPYRRNPYFTGRDDLLDWLDQQLTPAGQNETSRTRRAALTQPQAIKGLGGVGKTQIAVEYTYRARDLGRYTHTLWINAASEETVITSFREIAELLPSFSEKDEADQQKLVEAIKRWLERCKQQWLLIFDNADDLSLMHKYLPHQGNGSILLTTRAHAVGSLATSVEVETMGFVEGTQLLLRRAQRFEHASNEEINQAGNIVVALDHFPLALDQAGAYIEETQCSFEDYLDLYQTHNRDLLARRGTSTDYPHSVATTWLLSFQKVEQANPAAAELLQLCCFLAPDQIPEELLKDGGAYWPASLQQAVADPLLFQELVADLLKFSLVKRFVEDHVLSIHRLVQAVQLDMMESDVQRQWAERVVLAVNRVFPDHPQDTTAWPQCLRYLDQVQACDTLIRQHMLYLIEAPNLLERTGVYLDRHALYAIAEPLYLHALSISKQLLGLEHPQVASLLNDLAVLYRNQGKYAEAESLYRQAVAIYKQPGPEYSRIADPLNNLATLYSVQGKYVQAEPLFWQALRIWEQQLGPEHSQVAYPLDGLAILYSIQRRYTEAELLYRRALAIRERRWGPEHPDVADSLNGLANLYLEQGRYTEAEPLYQRTLRIREQQLGSEHPRMASSLNNLAILYCKQRRYTEAEPLYQRVLAIRERQWGPVHSEVAASLNNLASLYLEQGRYTEAEPLYQRALRVTEQQLRPEHPQVADPLNGLAILYFKQGRYMKAEPLYRRALRIREQSLGRDHHSTQQVRKQYALLLRKVGHDKEARKLEERS